MILTGRVIIVGGDLDMLGVLLTCRLRTFFGGDLGMLLVHKKLKNKCSHFDLRAMILHRSGEQGGASPLLTVGVLPGMHRPALLLLPLRVVGKSVRDVGESGPVPSGISVLHLRRKPMGARAVPVLHLSQ